MKKNTWLSWSTGKDSAWAFHQLKNDPTVNVTAIFSSVNSEHDRVCMHSTRVEILKQQAQQLGVPLHLIELPQPCDNETYEAKMGELITKAEQQGVTHMAFGDLYLEDIKAYREKTLADTNIQPIFPLWQIPTKQLANEMVNSGLKAIVTCIDSKQIPEEFLGRTFDENFIADLPEGVDPCGENGEFHTCVYEGPMFTDNLTVKTGEIHQDGQFYFEDVKIDI